MTKQNCYTVKILKDFNSGKNIYRLHSRISETIFQNFLSTFWIVTEQVFFTSKQSGGGVKEQ